MEQPQLVKLLEENQQLRAALKPFADAEKAWVNQGERVEIRMDWLTRARELVYPSGVCKYCGALGDLGTECDRCEPLDGLGPMVYQKL